MPDRLPPQIPPLFNVRPPRKPTPLEQALGENRKGLEPEKFPLVAAGIPDSTALGDTKRELQGGGFVTRGAFYPNEPDWAVQQLIKERGLAHPDFARDVMFIGAEGFPQEDNPDPAGTVKHEFRHRGLQRMQDAKDALTFNVRLPKLALPTEVGKVSWFDEEDYVRLLGAVTGTEKFEDVDAHFARKVGKHVAPPSTEALLNNPTVLKALISIQKQADEFNRERGGPASLIHFPTEEELEIGLFERRLEIE